MSRSGLSKRDEYVLAYAEYLYSDPTLWRITIVYLYTCGTIGEEQGDQVLMRIPLRLNAATIDLGEEQRLDAVADTVKEISSICREYGRELVRRAVCRVSSTLSLFSSYMTYFLRQIASSTLTRSKKYGLAMSYSISAEDWPGLGRIIDAVLDEYIQNGELYQKFSKSPGPHSFLRATTGPVVFAGHAFTISPLLEQVHSNTQTEAIFAHRLMFAVKYSQIHKMRLEQDYSTAASDLVILLRDEIAPKSWWPILLCDSVEFLQYGMCELNEN